MSKSQVKKCDLKPGEKWTDGCCSSQLVEHAGTGKLEDSIVQATIEPYLSESESPKH
jgi:hypothetical protein